MPDLVLRPATAADAGAVAAIYNQGIEDRIATFETRRYGTDEIAARILDARRWPIQVATDGAGEVLGWAGLSAYRPRDCYAGIAEFSFYVDRRARGRGLGTRLLDSLVQVAAGRGFWKLVSRIFPENTASRAACLRCGFREVGVYEKHGQLDGRWRDVVIVERLIPENLLRAEAQRSP